MVMSYRESTNKAKDARRGLIEQRPVSKRKRSRREWRVLVHSPHWSSREFTIYRGKSREACERWITKETRNPYAARLLGYRVVGPEEEYSE